MMNDDSDLPTAREVRPGVFLAECPHTHQMFRSSACRFTQIGLRPVVWTRCGCCDAYMRTGKDCDPDAPQFHLYLIEVPR